jgi:hypothetical protein
MKSVVGSGNRYDTGKTGEDILQISTSQNKSFKKNHAGVASFGGRKP